MGEFIGMVIGMMFAIGVALGVKSVGQHYLGKWQCEETHNVNHCERDLTYTPTYPEVTE